MFRFNNEIMSNKKGKLTLKKKIKKKLKIRQF